MALGVGVEGVAEELVDMLCWFQVWFDCSGCTVCLYFLMSWTGEQVNRGQGVLKVAAVLSIEFCF